MATKKKIVVKKKVVVKKKAATPVKRTIPVPVTEVFSTITPERETVSVPRNSVLLYVNGLEKGTVDTSGQKLGAFVTAQAQRAGIRTFSVYIDGRKADTSDAGKALTGVSKIELVAKDARG